MVTVAEELPFAAAVDDDKLDTVCSNCFAIKSDLNKVDLKPCDKCAVFHYCSNKCMVEDWKFHKHECEYKARTGYVRMNVLRLLCRFIMRIKREGLPVAFNGHTFDDLMGFKDEHKNDRFNIYPLLVDYMGQENAPSFDEFLSFYGKKHINSFDIVHQGMTNPREYLGIGIYLGFSAHKHSCRPNADYYFNGSKMVLRALDPNAKYSKDLTILQTPPLFPRKIRQEFARCRYFVDCNCERCMDEEIDLWERSGKSNCCPEEGVVLPVHRNFLWYWKRPLVCTNCGKKADITLEQINKANEKISEIYARQNEIYASGKGFDELTRLLKKMESILSPFNLYLLQFMGVVCSLEAVIKNKDSSTDPQPHSQLVLRTKFALKKASEKYSVAQSHYSVHCAMLTLVNDAVHYTNISESLATKFQKATAVVLKWFDPEYPLHHEIARLHLALLAGHATRTINGHRINNNVLIID